MNTESGGTAYHDLLALSKRLQRANGAWSRLEDWYWQLMYVVNRSIEKLGYPRKLDIEGEAVLYFGCGVHFTRAINSDLFAIHRYLRRRPRPDVYLSGLSVSESLSNRFDGIICEHVLEHMLPTHAHRILSNLRKMLKSNGSIQISVPSPSRFISCSDSVSAMDIVSINDIAYNYGHKFMYDEGAVIALVDAAGFREIEVNSYASSPWKEYLVAEREPQSIYIIARKL